MPARAAATAAGVGSASMKKSKPEPIPVMDYRQYRLSLIHIFKKLFVDDVDSLELLLAHSVPEGIANLLIPLVIYIAMFCADWKLALS